MRPAGPLPATNCRSRPRSQARRRTAGEATGLSPVPRQPAGCRRCGVAGRGRSRRRRLAVGEAPRRAPPAPAAAGTAAVGEDAACCPAQRPLRRCPRRRLRGASGRCPRRARRRPCRRAPGRRRRPATGSRRSPCRSSRRRATGPRATESPTADVPLDELGLGDAFADVGQLDHVQCPCQVLHHASHRCRRRDRARGSRPIPARADRACPSR